MENINFNPSWSKYCALREKKSFSLSSEKSDVNNIGTLTYNLDWEPGN